MASTSQHRCVFVGNIPYDATEEQLIQICEEVGPVVSFRLVTDRETGKPKGYGFCEYKDEETALSARRNLLGYEINGRQLRVDFAENDKGSDRNREQGRGGPGMTANADPQKQVGDPAILGDSAHQQPIGLSLATAAASIMAGTLGGAQVGSKANPSGLYSQAGLGGDPLTLHLAKMSRSQLNEIFSELKAMATEDKELARQLLLANPQFPKALFQAQIMLGTVTPEMLQMPNIRQGGSLLQPLSQDAQQSRLPAFGAPIAQNKMQFGMTPKVQEGQASAMPQSSLVTNQVSAVPQPHTLSRVQMPHVAPIQVQQPSFPAHSGVSTLPSIAPKSLFDLTARPQIHVATSSSSSQKMQVPLLQHSGRYETANTGHNRQVANPNVTVPLLTRPPVLDPRLQTQPCSSMMSNVPESMKKDSDRSGQATSDANWVRKINNNSNLTSGPLNSSMVHDNSEPLGRPSKLVKLADGRNIPLPLMGLNGPTTSGSGPSRVIGMGSSPANQIPKAQNQQSEQQVSQLQLSPEVESALLQQVMNLTPEQLSLLPPDQQQQVIQLQQMLR